ncbi:hypothetical protein [Endozoicomonas ascidiicola]|uniref:hypothetical protein n=1 Tax=Endozoicomonas ascidiicola TaxID=1698521 RepID=UPI000834A881|nr:hypothetical protein [Endozoicomonas ascidiicola]
MNQSIIVYGPVACGKTRNAKKIAEKLGLKNIVDDWVGRRRAFNQKGTLYLTEIKPAWATPENSISYNKVMRSFS